MQTRRTKYFAGALAGTYGAMLALISTATTLPVQSKSLLASAKPAQTAVSKDESAKKADTPATSGSGTLLAMAGSGKELGQCPLKHTDVSCDIAGYVARVTVKQTFHNPYKDKIEALYTFPLSQQGAVDEMVMKVGERTIHGTIKKREEARQIYEQARANGQTASLLDQERSNIFSQSVANIEPGKDIEITIKYVETLNYDKGKYSFVFPTVVGPRFTPPTTNVEPLSQTTTLPGEKQYVKEGQRSGHDLSLNVHLNAGMAVSDLKSQLHEIKIENGGPGKADISLLDKNTIANRDFVLSWNVAQDNLKSGYLTYRDAAVDQNGYFTLMLVPPKRVSPDKIAPKEMIFVIDCSGSQSGPPLDKAKETMRYILDHMNADDTFQIIAFSDTTRTFAAQPEKVSEAMKEKAHKFISALQANGGTWMAPAVEEACKAPADQHRLRIVTFMTDGFVGNDLEILGMIKKLRGVSRWFPFGTGNSVNGMLIDGMAREGGGEADYVLLNSSGEAAGKKFYDRIASPVLTDIKIKIDGVKTAEVFPREVSDVWAEKPLYFKGKYTAGGAGTVTLSGFAAGQPYEQKLTVNFPQNNAANPGIASLWARAKVDRLMSEDYLGAQNGTPNKELKEEIVNTALAHHIITQYTSFVAVEEKNVTKNGKFQTITVPLEMPDGLDRNKIFGKDSEARGLNQAHQAGQTNGYYQSSAFARRRLSKSPNFGNFPISRAMGSPGFAYGNAIAGGGGTFASFGKTKSLAYAMPLASPAPISMEKTPSSDSAINARKEPLNEVAKPKDESSEIIDKKVASKNNHSQQSKLSFELQKLLNSKSANDQPILITVSLKKLTATNIASLKTLGLIIAVPDKGLKLKANQVCGYLSPSRIKELAGLDFVLAILLNSDRK